MFFKHSEFRKTPYTKIKQGNPQGLSTPGAVSAPSTCLQEILCYDLG